LKAAAAQQQSKEEMDSTAAVQRGSGHTLAALRIQNLKFKSIALQGNLNNIQCGVLKSFET
jgi:hypothetical protein